MSLTREVFGRELSEDLGISESLGGMAAGEEREEHESPQSELEAAAVSQQPLPVHHCPPGDTHSTHTLTHKSTHSLQGWLDVAGSQGLQDVIQFRELFQVIRIQL